MGETKWLLHSSALISVINAAFSDLETGEANFVCLQKHFSITFYNLNLYSNIFLMHAIGKFIIKEVIGMLAIKSNPLG